MRLCALCKNLFVICRPLDVALLSLVFDSFLLRSIATTSLPTGTSKLYRAVIDSGVCRIKVFSGWRDSPKAQGRPHFAYPAYGPCLRTVIVAVSDRRLARAAKDMLLCDSSNYHNFHRLYMLSRIHYRSIFVVGVEKARTPSIVI